MLSTDNYQKRENVIFHNIFSTSTEKLQHFLLSLLRRLNKNFMSGGFESLKSFPVFFSGVISEPGQNGPDPKKLSLL
jgi:hypothetical protein